MSDFDDDQEKDSLDEDRNRSPEPRHDPHSRSEQQLAAKISAGNRIGRLFSPDTAVSRVDTYVEYVVRAVPGDDFSTLTDCEIETNQTPHHSIQNVEQCQAENRTVATPFFVVLEEDDEEKKNSPDLNSFRNRYWKYSLAALFVLFVCIVARIAWYDQ